VRAPVFSLLLATLGFAPPLRADPPRGPLPPPYRVTAARIPDDDRSGPLGPRLRALLGDQVARNLRTMESDRVKAGIDDPDAIASGTPYFEYFAAGTAYAGAVLVRCGEPGETTGGLSRDRLRRRAVRMIQAVARQHPLGGGSKPWSTFNSARIIHVLGMAAWLLWDDLDRPTQRLVARIVEHEADRFLDRPAPARLVGDTQAESNAWTGGGLAVAACMLRSHPHRARWARKANEYMIGAYATADDVASGQVVDGRPLHRWLTAPNVFPDYTLENHGLVHPDYLGEISEMVRSAIAFRLAGEPVPQAVTFNADHVLDLLVFLFLPDGTELYPQNTDYTPRRLDVFFQAGNVIAHRPSPLRKACLLRSLAALEAMAAECPDQPMNGWIGFPYDLGSTWGLTQNYLTFRLFGDGGEALPDDRLEASLAGTFVSEHGQFAVHRTPTTISSFSWRPAAKGRPPVMGLTMPLDEDVLCYPMPWSYVGRVCEPGGRATLEVGSHRVTVGDGGLAVTVELGWCSGKVRQHSTFVSLPDGRSVYLEERRAAAPVTVERATSGDVCFFDDVRWRCQAEPRALFAERGRLEPHRRAIHEGGWVNVDNRLGCAVLGADRFRSYAVPGRPGIWRGEGTMYDTLRLEFVHVAPDAEAPGPASFDAGRCLGRFAMVSCPNQPKEETAALAQRMGRAGWRLAEEGALAIALDRYLVYSNSSPETKRVPDGRESVPLAPETCGWVIRPGF